MDSGQYISDRDVMKAKLKALESGKMSFWKPDGGDTTIRIMPKLPGQKTFWFDVNVHFIGNKSYVCLADPSSDVECVACTLSDKLIESDDSARQEKGARMQQKVISLVNVAIHHGTPDAVVKIWTVPSSIIQDLISLYFGDYPGFDHPKTGQDLILNRVGTGLATRYKLTPRKNPSQTTKSLMAARKDLEKVTKRLGSKELRAVVVSFVKS